MPDGRELLTSPVGLCLCEYVTPWGDALLAAIRERILDTLDSYVVQAPRPHVAPSIKLYGSGFSFSHSFRLLSLV